MNINLLPCSIHQLNLDVVLKNGQSFRWKKLSDNEKTIFFGVAKNRVWKVWRHDDNNIAYEVIARFEDESLDESDYKSLSDYFQLDVNLEELYRNWALKDENFKKQLLANPTILNGIRVLKQSLLETIFAFICSSNNNISRITGLVEKLCIFYGSKTVSFDNLEIFYNFPTLQQLSKQLPNMETKLRESGFGYRAKYISETVKKLTTEMDGELWLKSLHDKTYEEAKNELLKLPGIGPKVANCICLMALQKHHVVPVDTHVFKITTEVYSKQIQCLKNQKKILNKGMHEEIGSFYAERFGPYAGWAQTVLFSNRLRQFKIKIK